jgi:predicted RNA-binding protein YlqC (UPF0109 family)
MGSSEDLVKQWLIGTLGLIVDHPEDVTLHSFEEMGRVTIQFRSNRGEIGKLIGKGGRHADALRTLVRAMGKKSGVAFTLEFAREDAKPLGDGDGVNTGQAN